MPSAAKPGRSNAAAVENPPRNSGSKRDLESAQATDVINYVPSSDDRVASSQPPVKKKVRYFLPQQNMEEGHFYVVLGDDIDVSTQRFKILSLLGEGTFGKVVEAWDRKLKEYCAVKIVRNIEKYVRDASYEVHYMKQVAESDPEDAFALTKLKRFFVNEGGHPCIVMSKHGSSLLSWIERHGPMPRRSLAETIFHIGVALDVLHTQLRLIHTDLKPENLLFNSNDDVPIPGYPSICREKKCRVRICDLGGCCDERHSKNAIVSTRHYRSPEVILGLGWMFSTDMWSMGCIIYELATGRLLYDTHDNHEHLHMMERTAGKLPSEWHKLCTDDMKEFFTTKGVLKPPSTPRSAQNAGRLKPIDQVIEDPLLANLIVSLLQYDRTKRLSARQMACHPFVVSNFPECLDHPNHPKNRVGLIPPPLM